MKIQDTLSKLWSLDYFKSYKPTKKVVSTLLTSYGITSANIYRDLKNTGFLRKSEAGWIQKMPFQSSKTNEKTPDYFSLLKIHPRIEKASKKLFTDKHYSPAILEAFKMVNLYVKQKSGRNDLDGKSLMLQVFSPNAPVLKLNSLTTLSEKDEQEGFMHLFAGAIVGIRNPKAHDIIIQNKIHKALCYLMFASLLCDFIDNSIKS